MTLSPNINNLEADKFEETVDGKTAVRIIGTNDWLNGEIGNKIVITYPSGTTEVYTFKNGATTYKEYTLTYSSASKTELTLVERTA